MKVLSSVESLMCLEREFQREAAPLRDGEPAEFLEDGGDVVTGEQVSSRVLDRLEFIRSLDGGPQRTLLQ